MEYIKGFLNFLISWCNSNQGFAIVVLTLIYVLTTRKIAKANQDSVWAMKESVMAANDSTDVAYQNIDFQDQMRKQNVRITLYEIRIRVYDHFVKAINTLRSNDYSRLNIIAKDIAAQITNTEKLDVDFNFKEIGYVFGKEYNDKIDNLLKSAGEVARQISLFKDIERESIVNKENSNSVIIEENGIKKSYNFKKEKEKRIALIKDFEKEYQAICEQLEKELYLNYIG